MEATQVLVQTLIVSGLAYCHSVLLGLLLCAIRLQYVIQNLPKAAYIIPLLPFFHWLSVAALFRFKIQYYLQIVKQTSLHLPWRHLRYQTLVVTETPGRRMHMQDFFITDNRPGKQTQAIGNTREPGQAETQKALKINQTVTNVRQSETQP